MSRSLSLLFLTLSLAAVFPAFTLADDTADKCRKMAAEEEVPAEDMEDYIAECVAVIESESTEEDPGAMDQTDEAAPDSAQDSKR